MNVSHSVHPSVPLFRGSEQQVAKLRKRLEEVFRNVSLAHDVVPFALSSAKAVPETSTPGWRTSYVDAPPTSYTFKWKS